MAIFSDPVTFNDGTSDHIFNFRAQIPEANSIVGEWVEPLSTSAVDTKIVVKHTKDKYGTERHLLQISQNTLLADGVTYEPLVMNITLNHKPSHPEAAILLFAKLGVAALTDGNITNLSRGYI